MSTVPIVTKENASVINAYQTHFDPFIEKDSLLVPETVGSDLAHYKANIKKVFFRLRTVHALYNVA